MSATLFYKKYGSKHLEVKEVDPLASVTETVKEIMFYVHFDHVYGLYIVTPRGYLIKAWLDENNYVKYSSDIEIPTEVEMYALLVN